MHSHRTESEIRKNKTKYECYLLSFVKCIPMFTEEETWKGSDHLLPDPHHTSRRTAHQEVAAELDWLTRSRTPTIDKNQSGLAWPSLTLESIYCRRSHDDFCARSRYQGAGKSNYIPQCLWDLITCPCPWYMLLVGRLKIHGHNSRFVVFRCS